MTDHELLDLLEAAADELKSIRRRTQLAHRMVAEARDAALNRLQTEEVTRTDGEAQ